MCGCGCKSMERRRKPCNSRSNPAAHPKTQRSSIRCCGRRRARAKRSSSAEWEIDAATGAVFNPKDGVHPLRDLREPLFGSDLACADPIEDFFAWKEQAIVGAEDVSGVKCQILESKPGKGDHSIYGSVRSWIDPQRLVPMRVEKYRVRGRW